MIYTVRIFLSMLPAITSLVCGLIIIFSGLNVRFMDRMKYSSFMFLFFLVCMCFVSFSYENDAIYLRASDIISRYAVLAVYPFFIVYFRKLTNRKFRLKRILPLFIPSFVVGTATLILYSRLNDAQLLNFTNVVYKGIGDTSSFDAAQWHLRIANWIVFFVVAIIQFAFAFYFIFKSRKHFGGLLKNFYSDDSHFLQMKKLTNVIFILFVVIATVSIMRRPTITSFPVIFVIYQISLSLILIVFTSVTQSFRVPIPSSIRSQISNVYEIHEAENAVNVGEIADTDELDGEVAFVPILPPEKINKLKAQLESLMEDDKVFLEKGLTVSMLSRMMGTNRTYLTCVLNYCYNTNFSDFINRARVKHAQQIMMKNDDDIMEVVGENSGFSSKTSFFRSFKVIANCSPVEWKKKNLLSTSLNARPTSV